MRALVIGASGGIGAALVAALAQRGEVVALSRRVDGLDVRDEASITEVLGALQGTFDITFVATGVLAGASGPEKALRSVTAAAMAEQFAVNTIGPALVIKHMVRLLPKDRAARIGVLSARVGSIGDNALGGWYSYRASKAALNQVIRTASVEVARSHPLAVLAALHPGTVETAFTGGFPAHDKVGPAVAAGNLLRVMSELTPAESGGFYDWAGKQVPW